MKKLTLFGFSSLSLSALIAPIFVVFGLIGVCTGPLAAQNPKISIQGTLKTASGASVSDGPQMVTFRLYNVAIGGTHLWEEVATVDVVGGIYSHYLGSITALNAGDFATTLYLGVRIGSYESDAPQRTFLFPICLFSVHDGLFWCCWRCKIFHSEPNAVCPGKRRLLGAHGWTRFGRFGSIAHTIRIYQCTGCGWFVSASAGV